MSTMTPQTEDTITNEQIAKLQDVLGAFLRKSGMSRKGLQDVLANHAGSFTKEFGALTRRHIEAHSDLITRQVNLIAGATVKDLIVKAGLNNGISDWVLNQLSPVKASKQAKLVFFKVDHDSKKELQQQLKEEYEIRGLVPADIQSVMTCASEGQLPCPITFVVTVEFISASDDKTEPVRQYIYFEESASVYLTGYDTMHCNSMWFVGLEK